MAFNWKTGEYVLPKYKNEESRRLKELMDSNWKLYDDEKAKNTYDLALKNIRADYIAPRTLSMNYIQMYGHRSLTPKKIIHNGPATVVIWGDGEKTVVKLMEGDTYDEYAAFTAALAKRIFGTTGYVKRMLKDVTVEQIKKDPEFKSWKEWAEHINNLFNDALAKAYSNKD